MSRTKRTWMPMMLCCLVAGVSVARAQRTVAEQYLALAVNQERAAAGLPGLAWNPPLASVAYQHAERMAATNTMSHQLRGEADLGGRVAAAGTNYPVLAENVGVGPSPSDLHRALMNSPHHRENILDPKVNSFGIAVVFARGSLWLVEDFAFDLPRLALSDQERQVEQVLYSTGLQSVGSSAEAREMCGMAEGFVGVRPAFTMRYTATALDRLPDELYARLSRGDVSHASVGACSPAGSGMYNIAVVLYR